jgi:integrase
MPIEMRKSSKWWYGRFNISGKVHVVNLGIEIEGQRPASITKEGNRLFERSRARAQAALESLVKEATERKRSEELIQRLHKIRTGDRIPSVDLKEIFDKWQAIPKRRRPSEQYTAWAKNVLIRFVSFIEQKYPRMKQMADVDCRAAVAFMNAEEKRNISNSTYNLELFLLRSTFKHLSHEAGMLENPFEAIVKKDKDSIHRQPFSPTELKAIVDAAADDDFMRPLIITAICTAMRRGDVCLLKWADIDMSSRFISVKTSKTGEVVSIPIFPLLYDELLRTPQTDSVFVFPAQAKMYQENPQGINWRVKKLLKKVGFSDGKRGSKKKGGGSRGSMHADRKRGLLRASVRGFHSFRTTWITLALSAGVPLELVRKVTGHRTADVVLKNCFLPGKDDLRRALQEAMPGLLTNGSHRKTDEIREIVEGMTPETCNRDKSRILKLVDALDADSSGILRPVD